MKVTVKDKHLNVRVGKPSVNAPCFQFIAPGSEIEVDGKLHKGDMFRGIDIWLRDEADNFYWSGGVSGNFLPETAGPSVSDKIIFNWFNRLGVNDVWNKFNEKGSLATIAILDTGINIDNAEIFGGVTETNIIIDAETYPETELIIKDESNEGHGSKCASLIGSRNNLKWITGIAPECKLLIGKISINREVRKFDFILKGIEWAISKGADVISISYAVELPPEIAAERNKQFEKLIAGKNVLIIAASGNSGGTPIHGERYPASFPACISVGALDADNNIAGLTILSDKTILHAPGINVEAFGKNQIPEPDSGTSFSTPIVAAIAGLAISHLKRNNKPFDKNNLIQKIINSGRGISSNPQKKIIDIQKLFDTL